MDFIALGRKAVEVYRFSPNTEAPSGALYTFPPVPTAEGYAWSNDGNFLGLTNSETGGVEVRNAAADYVVVCEVPPLIGGPIRNFYFSPLGRHLVTHERYAKESGANVGVWDIKSGQMKFSFILKKFTDMSWPPLKWTNLETHCCRMVQDGVIVMPGDLDNDDGSNLRIDAPGIMAFDPAPQGPGASAPHIALCIGESKGSPAQCHVYRMDRPACVKTAAKSFYKAQSVTMLWNSTGTSLLVKTATEVDDTGKNYYGGGNLYFMRADGSEDCIVAAADEGPVHDVQWNPVQDEFLLLHGVLPCNIALHSGKKGQKLMDFGRGHRNTIRFNTFGRFLVVGGYGQLLGDTDFWDKPGKQLTGNTRMECCVVSCWSPEGRQFLTATTSPRMRVDNKIVMYDYCGKLLFSMPFEELLHASWRPRTRGQFQDRPPSPERCFKASAAGSRGGGKSGYGAEPKKQAYRPPGARSGGGLAELLRQELGSTAGDAATVATKVFGGNRAYNTSVPGAAPDDLSKAAGGTGSGSNRNARKKKAKGAAELQTGCVPEEEPDEAATASTAATAAARSENAQADEAVPLASMGHSSAGNDEVEKKVKALRKKLREIEKLKEKPSKDLDVLQRQKLFGEADLISQIRALGYEP